MLRRNEYAQILDRYRDRMYQYDLRPTTLIFSVYRTAFLKSDAGGMAAFTEDMGLRVQDIRDASVANFYAGELELKIGESAPYGSFRDLKGEVFTSEDFSGKVVVLDFWATWCPPCIKEIPHLQHLYAEFGERSDFVLMSISLDKDRAKLDRFLADRDLPWTHVRDDSENGPAGYNHGGKLATTFMATGLPKYLLIDKRGILRYNSSLNEMKMIPEELVAKYLAD